jgi:hypothetical protein
MIVTTANSVYRVFEHPKSERARFSVEKIRDLMPGGHPNTHVGEVRWGNTLKVKLGESMVLSDRVDGHHEFWTTRVVGIVRG